MYATSTCSFRRLYAMNEYVRCTYTVVLLSGADIVHVCTRATASQWKKCERNERKSVAVLWWYGNALIVRISLELMPILENVHAFAVLMLLWLLLLLSLSFAMTQYVIDEPHCIKPGAAIILFALHAFYVELRMWYYIALQILTACLFTHGQCDDQTTRQSKTSKYLM